MKTHLFTPAGASIDTLAKETKIAAKAERTKLKETRDRTAQKEGFSSWQDMVEHAVEMAPGDLIDAVVKLRGGQDIITLYLDALTGLAAYDPYTEIVQPLFLQRKLVVVAEGLVGHEITYNAEKPLFTNTSEFTPRHPFTYQDFLTMTEGPETVENTATFINILHSSGFFDGLLDVPLDESEHEAMLELMMRKRGRSVRDRIVFNTGDAKTEVIDYDKRCFANLLDDGSVVVSNGAEHGGMLVWKILPRTEFDALVREMKVEKGSDAMNDGHGEIWMHNRVLLHDVEATRASDPLPREIKADLLSQVRT